MATIDIGKLAFTHKGDYDGSTAYVARDVVYYNGSAYIAKTSTTGNLPTSTAHWSTFASGSGGIWNSGLSLGSAGQIVQVNSGASALEFTDAPAGGVVQTKFYQTGNTFTATNQSFADLSGFSISITPTSASNKILLSCSFGRASGHDNGANTVAFVFTRDGSQVVRGDANGNRDRYTASLLGVSYSSDNHSDALFFQGIDSPNTTSAITYKVQNRIENGTLSINRNQSYSNTSDVYNGTGHSCFIAQEIVG